MVIKFFAPVIDVTIKALMNTIGQKIKQGVTNFIILISSPGGSVFHGLSAYDYLKGLPAKITTHNFGSVDSIGIVLYCGGLKRGYLYLKQDSCCTVLARTLGRMRD